MGREGCLAGNQGQASCIEIQLVTIISGKETDMAERQSGKDNERLKALIKEATVDCYGEEEQHSGLLTMIEEEVVCREALEYQQALVNEYPLAPQYRQALALTHFNLALLLRKLLRTDEAIAEFKEALELRTRLADDFPGIAYVVSGSVVALRNVWGKSTGCYGASHAQLCPGQLCSAAVAPDDSECALSGSAKRWRFKCGHCRMERFDRQGQFIN